MGRRFLRATTLAMLAAAVPAIALAHPLGNFTINHYAGIQVASGTIRLDVVIDMAEIPTFQERQQIDTDGDGDVTDSETLAAAGPACDGQGRLLRLEVDGSPSKVRATSASIVFPPGLGGLSTMRLECAYIADLPVASSRTTITFEDASYPERIGWREIVATTNGPTIASGGLPTTSVSNRLTTYPTDLVAQPLDMRSATIRVSQLPGVPAASPAASAASGVSGASVADAASQARAGAVPGGVGGELPAIFNQVDLTPFVLLASIVTAFGLGAAHAVTPGHGKTLMAAYLVGRRGTPIHAVGLGLSVSVSHTLGILVLAAVIVGAQGLLSPDTVVRVAPVIAALTILAIGGWMVARETWRRIKVARAPAAAHDHHSAPDEAQSDRADPHEHEHNHGHAAAAPEEDPQHSHGGVRHSHLPVAGSTISWRGLFALGLAGGLIPSTSALIILLGSIVAGRPAFGFLLVVVFGLGMAAVMTAVGLVMVLARGRLDLLPPGSGLGRLAVHAQLVAAVVVLAFGVYLTVQAVGGRPVF